MTLVPEVRYIDRNEALDTWFVKLDTSLPLSLDTEFIRERTFYPKLALVQVAQSKAIALIDVLAVDEVTALTRAIMRSRNTIVHSASEDLFVLKYALDVKPKHLFDTQIAACFAGLGESLSYQALCEQILGVTVEKGETRSNWLQRPLRDAQKKYAALDVKYLYPLAEALEEKLLKGDHYTRFKEDCQTLIDKASDDTPDADPHLGFRPAAFFAEEQQLMLRRLLRWRDAKARKHDRPKSWMLHNNTALKLAEVMPVSRHVFDQVLNDDPKSPKKHRDDLWALMQAPPEADEAHAVFITPETPELKKQIKDAQNQIAAIAHDIGLPPTVIASKKRIKRAFTAPQWTDEFNDWRQEVLTPVFTAK